VPGLTAEDRLRAQSYQAQIERRESEAQAGSLDEFLPSLQMAVEIGRWNAMTGPRIAQLVIKTNQFNTTTRRVSEAELAELDEGGLGVYWLRLTDRYGDMGLIAVAVLTKEGTDAVVHSFVLSCRAANRAMEQTLLAYLATKAREGGCTRLIGELIPTAKNAPVMDLFPKLGFVLAPSKQEGVTRYAFDLSKDDLVIPAFIGFREERSP
jgi:FkbH-like protein